MASATITLRPQDVRNSRFTNSRFHKSEMESMLSCIAITQHRMNPDEWTPFTWDEYVAKCDHKVIATELRIFEAMVAGGKVWLGSNWYHIEAGYLTKDAEGRYEVTEKLLAVMLPYKS